MDQATSIDDLAACKRFAQVKMAIHRAEMVHHCQELTAPLRTMRSGLGRITTYPIVFVALAAVVGGLGFLLVRGRFSLARRAAGLFSAFLFPRVRSFVTKGVWSLLLKGAQKGLRGVFSRS